MDVSTPPSPAARSARELAALIEAAGRLLAGMRRDGPGAAEFGPLLDGADATLATMRQVLPPLLRRVVSLGASVGAECDAPMAALRSMALDLYGQAQCAAALAAIPPAEWGARELLAELAHGGRTLVLRAPTEVVVSSRPGGVVVHALSLGLSGAGATREAALDDLAALALGSWDGLVCADEASLSLDAQAAAAHLRAQVEAVRERAD